MRFAIQSENDRLTERTVDMSTDENNPYQTPNEAFESPTQSTAKRPSLLFASMAAITVAGYALLSLALVYGDSASDIRMGELMLCNVPLMWLWLWANWTGRASATPFGLAVALIQFLIGCAMFVLLRRVPQFQIIAINGTTAAAVLGLTFAMHRYRRSTKTRYGTAQRAF